MKALIITIGDEILIGQIVDTNSSYIAKALDKIGIATTEMLSISDEKQHILKTFQYALSFNVVVITGGLGPTKDDITKKTFCDFFDDHLVQDADVYNHVKYIIEHYLKRPMTKLNEDQALVPSKARILFNKMGTAPGMLMEKDQTVFVSLPGVPYEMKYLVDEELIPYLKQKFKRPSIVHKTLLTYGQGESLIAERIEDWENNLPEFIKLAYLPSPGRVRLRLTARGEKELELKNAIMDEVDKLKTIISDILVGFEEDETIEVVLANKLIEKGLTIATIESCTGGKIAHLLSKNAGSSAYFKGSLVAYDTTIKKDVLGIESSLIASHSVVSKEVAAAMAQKGKELFQTDVVIATTGNAGPSKGDSDAEIGIVFLSIITPNGQHTEEFNFGQPREKVVERAINKALELVLKEI